MSLEAQVERLVSAMEENNRLLQELIAGGGPPAGATSSYNGDAEREAVQVAHQAAHQETTEHPESPAGESAASTPELAEREVSMDDLKAALGDVLKQEGGKQKVTDMLARFGAGKLSEVLEQHYIELYEMAQEELGNG